MVRSNPVKVRVREARKGKIRVIVKAYRPMEITVIISGATVSYQETKTFHRTKSVDYVFTVPQGSYFVYVRADGYMKERGVIVREGKEEVASFEIKAPEKKIHVEERYYIGETPISEYLCDMNAVFLLTGEGGKVERLGCATVERDGMYSTWKGYKRYLFVTEKYCPPRGVRVQFLKRKAGRMEDIVEREGLAVLQTARIWNKAKPSIRYTSRGECVRLQPHPLYNVYIAELHYKITRGEKVTKEINVFVDVPYNLGRPEKIKLTIVDCTPACSCTVKRIWDKPEIIWRTDPWGRKIEPLYWRCIATIECQTLKRGWKTVTTVWKITTEKGERYQETKGWNILLW